MTTEELSQVFSPFSLRIRTCAGRPATAVRPREEEILTQAAAHFNRRAPALTRGQGAIEGKRGKIAGRRALAGFDCLRQTLAGATPRLCRAVTEKRVDLV